MGSFRVFAALHAARVVLSYRRGREEAGETSNRQTSRGMEKTPMAILNYCVAI